ncbi:MAG TPA: chemotaxis protein CheW [Aliidongia sp.]|nr:chemotaxis protein CheW [Aliidongia sp.]
MSGTAISARAAELREAFDRSFAAPPRPDEGAAEDLLAIRIGGDPYAVRLSEIAGVHTDRKIVRVPGAPAALLGIAGFRGAIVPVYGTRDLLGDPGPAGRWLMLAAAAPIALSFELFEHHLRVPAGAVKPQEAGGERRFVRELVRTHSFVRPILHLAAIVAAVTPRPATASREER